MAQTLPFFRTQIFPVHSHMSPGKFLSFFGIFYDRTERFFRSLCTYGNGSTALRFYICAFSEAATGGSVTISMLLYSGFAAPLIENSFSAVLF